MARPKGGTNQIRTCQEKAQLVEEYYNSGMGYKRFAQNYGISPSLFNMWIKKYEEGGVEALRHSRRKASPFAEQKDNEEILKLKLIIAEQQIQIERLKDQLSNKN